MSRRCDLLSVGVMSGNKVSHSNRKTRRKFRPNLQNIAFKSETLGVSINLKVATSTLRTINKYGSLDSFLVNFRFAKLSDEGKRLRLKIKRKLIKAGKLYEVDLFREKKVIKKKETSLAGKSE